MRGVPETWARSAAVNAILAEKRIKHMLRILAAMEVWYRCRNRYRCWQLRATTKSTFSSITEAARAARACRRKIRLIVAFIALATLAHREQRRYAVSVSRGASLPEFFPQRGTLADFATAEEDLFREESWSSLFPQNGYFSRQPADRIAMDVGLS